jgi:hypothetical protein
MEFQTMGEDVVPFFAQNVSWMQKILNVLVRNASFPNQTKSGQQRATAIRILNAARDWEPIRKI